MKSAYTIISFGSTQPEVYAQCAARLEASCEKYSIDNSISTIEFPEGDRKDICLYKPTFILDELLKKKSPILWLDCDVDLVCSLPKELPKGKWDIGFAPNPAHRLDRRLKRVFAQRFSLEPQKLAYRNPVAGFALAVNYTPNAIKFLQNWKYLCHWRNLAFGGDHVRMCWARPMSPIKECNLASFLHRKVIFNSGRPKELHVGWTFVARNLPAPR